MMKTKMEKAKEILVKELKNLARFLIDDGSNKEYTRGICELIADIDGIPELDHSLRAEQIRIELLNQNKDGTK
jgi:hypothetical protein